MLEESNVCCVKILAGFDGSRVPKGKDGQISNLKHNNNERGHNGYCTIFRRWR
jgi:hypothetical protein